MWKCAGCGETVDDQFEICWKCQQPNAAGTPESAAPEPFSHEGRAYGIGFFGSRSPWIKLPLAIFLLVVAFGFGYIVFEYVFRGVPCPR
jgi:hypothetical protein